MSKRKKPTYSSEFKSEAISLALKQNYTIAKAAANLGISESALRKWINAAKKEDYFSRANRNGVPGGKLQHIDDGVNAGLPNVALLRLERYAVKDARTVPRGLLLSNGEWLLDNDIIHVGCMAHARRLC